MEADLVMRAEVPFEANSCGRRAWGRFNRLPGNAWQLWQGYQASRRILRRFQPDVMFFTGGFVAIPMALAGHKIPSVLYVPDIEPGLALKTLSRLASKIAVTEDDSHAYFPDILISGLLVILPVRTCSTGSRESAKNFLDWMQSCLHC